MKRPEPFYLLDSKKIQNPFPEFAYYREHEPVFFCEPINLWFVFKYEDVKNLFKDPRLSSKRVGSFLSFAPEHLKNDMLQCQKIFEEMMIMQDGQEHRRLRQAFNHGFTPKVVQATEELIHQVAEELIAKVKNQGYMDFAQDYAHILPVAVICHLLGVPQTDRKLIQKWSDHIANFFNEMPNVNEQNTLDLINACKEMSEYVEKLIELHREKPGQDFFSGVISSGHLTDAELISNAVLILIAGHETTRNLIGSLFYNLLTHPEQLEMVKTNSDLYKNAVEEALRFEPAHPIIPRLTLEEIEVCGVKIPEGQFVELCIGSANHDPEKFPNPDVFDITRDAKGHVTFGTGPHQCIGGYLAQAEAVISLKLMLKHFPNLRLDETKPIVWQYIANLRGPKSLPILF